MQLFLFMVLLLCLVVFAFSAPRAPYWNDYHAQFFVNFFSFGEEWSSAGKIWYQGSKNRMRVDYYGLCEPHFKFDNHNFTCTYLFSNNTAYFRTEKDCCIYQHDFNAISPDYIQRNGHYEGVEIVHGKVVNVWVHNEGVPYFKWYADYNTYEGLRFGGQNAELFGKGFLDLAYFDTSTIMNDSIFAFEKSCNVKCPFPPFLSKNERQNFFF